jgi:hypothetical protein
MQQTSLDSYNQLRPTLGDKQRRVYNALKALCAVQKNATDMELARSMGESDPNRVRPRRNELVYKHELVRQAGKRFCAVTGRLAIAWRIT